MDCVYFITGIERTPISSYSPAYREYISPLYPNGIHYRTRTFLWKPTYEVAEYYVLNNIADISEGGTNTWMVIEGLAPEYSVIKASPQVFFQSVGDYWKNDDFHYEKLSSFPKELEEYYDSAHLLKIFATIG